MISSSFGRLSPWEKFSWGVLSTLCTRIPIQTKSLDWIFSYHIFIERLCSSFKKYCSTRELSDQECLLTDTLPQEIQNCPFDDVRNYFNWVKALQHFLYFWQKKFLEGHVSYDEIKMYGDNTENIMKIGRSVCASTYVMGVQDISRVEKTFTQCFEQLNCYLLQHVSNHPEVKYCTLPELLHCYGVSFPPELQETLQQKIIFPGNERNIPEEQYLRITTPRIAEMSFNPIKVTNSLSLCDFQKILEDLEEFLEPIIECIDMFIFFYLHKSKIFLKHLSKCLNNTAVASSLTTTDKAFLNPSSFIRTPSAFTQSFVRQTEDEGISIEVLQGALDSVKDLILKVIKGIATYTDIVADGTLDIVTLRIEEEFDILKKFAEMNGYNYEGLDGVKNMLDLFQLIHHIGKIRQVCEEYDLKQCLEDAKFEEMIEIAGQLEEEQSQAKLTPVDGKQKMVFIKEGLCLGQSNNYNCLNLFSVVADSAAFYQFIKDKKFDGFKGRVLFHEQYQLITAQLQHEEYDENVLNHLRVAYEFIAPFTEADISFSDLMNKVTKLNVDHGLKVLETVNANIVLIGRWFSRAEVSDPSS